MATAVKGKRGFLKMKPSELKTVKKTIFFTKVDFKKVELAAQKMDMSIQDYMRFKILAE